MTGSTDVPTVLEQVFKLTQSDDTTGGIKQSLPSSNAILLAPMDTDEDNSGTLPAVEVSSTDDDPTAGQELTTISSTTTTDPIDDDLYGPSMHA